MSTNVIAIFCTIGTAMVGMGVLVARAVNSFAKEFQALKEAMSALRLEIEKSRSEDRLEVRILIERAIKDCRKSCQILRHNLEIPTDKSS